MAGGLMGGRLHCVTGRRAASKAATSGTAAALANRSPVLFLTPRGYLAKLANGTYRQVPGGGVDEHRHSGSSEAPALERVLARDRGNGRPLVRSADGQLEPDRREDPSRRAAPRRQLRPAPLPP